MMAGTVLVCTLVACNKEQEVKEETNPENEVELVTEVIRASWDEGETKGNIAEVGGAFTWSEGDKIAVHTNNDGGTWYYSQALVAGDEGQTSANFTTTFAGTRDAVAVFPNSLVTEGADALSSGLTVTLPSSYRLADVLGDKAPTPMVAVNTGETLAFKHLCGLLRLTINGIPADATKLTVDFLGRKVYGDFTIAAGDLEPGEDGCIISTTSPSANDVITITGLDGSVNSVTVNIPLPAGTYDDVVITPYNGDDALELMAVRHIKGGSYTASRAHRRKLTATLVCFSIAADKKVVFAPGNLQYQAGSNTWRFAENQYDFVGDNTYGNVYVAAVKSSNALMASDYTGWIDMFGWGTSGWPNSGEGSSGVASWINYQPWASEDRVDHSATYPNNKWGYGPDNSDAITIGLTGTYKNGDWGVYNIIGSYSADTWRTPSQAEMLYAIGSTSGAGVAGHSTVGYATVSGISGIIILPDSFTDPMKNGGSGAFVNSETTEFTTNVYTASDWEYMESAGAVFLPGSGVRKEFVMSDISTPNVMIGYYWLNKAAGELPEKGCCIRFGHSYFYSDYAINRCYGAAVRLIRELN